MTSPGGSQNQSVNLFTSTHQPPSTCLFYPHFFTFNTFCGLFGRWIHETNPEDLGAIPAGVSGPQRNDGGGGFSAYLCLINHLWTLEAPGFISLSLFFFSCVFLLRSRPFVHSPTEIPSLPWTPLHVSPPSFVIFKTFYLLEFHSRH